MWEWESAGRLAYGVSGHVGVGAGADQGAEVQVQVGAELQAAVRVRDRHGALDVVGHRLASGV